MSKIKSAEDYFKERYGDNYRLELSLEDEVDFMATEYADYVLEAKIKKKLQNKYEL